VEVVLPRSFPLRNVESFVEEKRPWIERTLRRMRESETHFPPPRPCDGGEVPYLGERLSVRVRHERSRTRAHVSRRGSELTVKLGPRNGLHEALEAWYRRQARLEVAPRLDAAVARAGRSYSRLQIRGQRTRWASCSATGAMSFNWRLLLAPEPVLDYVVWHEVCHLDVMDHSPRFWALLAERCPDYRAHAAWLRRHGATLVL
jgi:predicted metal-dependent hydrolase